MIAKHRYSLSIRKHIAATVLAISALTCLPHSTFAETPPIADDAHYDGRIQNYQTDVELPASSNGMTWFLVLAMGVICVSVIFKDAKRSHLD